MTDKPHSDRPIPSGDRDDIARQLASIGLELNLFDEANIPAPPTMVRMLELHSQRAILSAKLICTQ